jgi:hypothetical protein
MRMPLWWGALLAASLSGCASFIAPPYAPDFSALDALKRVPMEKVTVGTVQPRDPAAAVNRVSLRGSSLTVQEGTFAHYLEDALIRDLRELSIFDRASQVRIDATLLKNEIDVSGIATGKGLMQVDVRVTRAGVQRYTKVHTATTEFESSFAGAVAIPQGQAEYGQLVRKLLGQLYTDPEFAAALRKERN